ncbi:MAG: hypothetical protein ACTHNN_05850 [Xanthobacteraceae bacterium]
MNIKASGRSALMVAAGIWLWCVGPLQAQEATQAVQPAAAQQATQPNALQQLFGAKPTPAAAPAAEQPAADAGQPVALNKYRKASSRHSRRHRASRSHRHSRRAAAQDKTASESKAKVKTTQAETEAASEARVADADNATVPDKANAAPAKDAETPLSSSVANAKAQLLDNHPTTGNVAPLAPAPASIADRSSPAMLNDGSPAPQPANAAAAEAPKTEAKNDAANEAGVVSSDEVNDVDRAMTTQAEPAPTLALASVNTPASVTTGQAASSDDNSSWAQASLIGKIFIAFGGLLTLASAVRMLIA